MYDIPREIKTRIKINRFFSFLDLAILGGVFLFLFFCKGLVHSALVIPYYIVFMTVAVVCNLPSPSNPKKRLGQSIYYALKRKKNTFHPL